MVAATGARTYAHGDDAAEIPVETDVLLADGDRLRFGAVELEVIHLVGHTPGWIALLYDEPEGPPHLLTADSLFPGGPGNTWGDAAAFASLMGDLEAKVFGRLPDETWVYPGHGHDTTLGAERPTSPSGAHEAGDPTEAPRRGDGGEAIAAGCDWASEPWGGVADPGPSSLRFGGIGG